METFGKKLSFGLGVVNAGQKNVAAEPELVAVTTTGSFRITSLVSKALGVANGDYVMFVTNWDGIDKAIAEKDETVVAFCEENGLDVESEEAYAAIHKEFDVCGIAKGIKVLDKTGTPVLVRERISNEARKNYVNANYDELVAKVNDSEDEVLKAQVNREGATKEEIVEVLASMITGNEVPKYRGSKAANSSNLSGVGVPLTFTDSNIWTRLREGADEESNKVFAVDIKNLQEVEIDNGYKVVKIKVAMLTDSREVKSARKSRKEVEEIAE